MWAVEINSAAHEATTGPEILAQCPDVDVFVAGLGTSGTLMGVARYLRRVVRHMVDWMPSMTNETTLTFSANG